MVTTLLLHLLYFTFMKFLSHLISRCFATENFVFIKTVDAVTCTVSEICVSYFCEVKDGLDRHTCRNELISAKYILF